MYFEIKDHDLENYTTIPVKDYVETRLQGYCDQCGENIPQEPGEPVFWCPEHNREIRRAEAKCPDCPEPINFNLGYYIIDGKITQHRKPYLLCGCDNELWLTFNERIDFSQSEEENNIPIATIEGMKWVHWVRSTQLIWDIWEEKLVKISKQHLFELSPAKICLLEDRLQSKIGDNRQRIWYNKMLVDAIELGVNIEILHPLLCQNLGSYMRYGNWPIENSVREIIEHNPTYFNDLISQKFETSIIAIRRILGGESEYKSGKRYKNPNITIYTFNEKFTQCDAVRNKIDDYTENHEQFHTNVINRCIAHCAEKEYKSRKTTSHQDLVIDIARENIKNLCDIYNDYVLDCLETLNGVQDLDIELPYKITFGVISKLNDKARQKLVQLLRDTDKQVTLIRESRSRNQRD